MSGAERPIRAAVGAFVVCLCLALPGAVLAATPETRPSEGALGGFKEPAGVAVDQSSGDIYVLDAGAGTVSRFDSALEPVDFPALGTNVIDGSATVECEPCDGTPAGGFAFGESEGDQVAVDNSGDPLTEGDIYVADRGHRVVDVFAPSGVYLGQLTATGESGPRLGEPCGVAVGPSGSIYVADPANDQIDEYLPAGNPPRDGDFVSAVGDPGCGLAVSATGALFSAYEWGSVVELESGGLWGEPIATGHGLAVDPLTGHLFATGEGEAAEYDPAAPMPATPIDSFGGSSLLGPQGIAVDAGRSRVYVADATAGDVAIFGPPEPVAAPRVTTGSVTPLPNGQETLIGFVDIEGASTTYYFEYGTANCATAACASAPAGQDGAVGKGGGPVRVAETLSGLKPQTTYHYRLVAVNAAGTTRSADRTFTTLPPPPAEECADAAVRARQDLPAAFPDCRAYEMVSAFPQAERNNVEVFPATDRIRAATSGGAFEFSTFGGAGDAAGSGILTSYVSVRDPETGWMPHGISPPQTSQGGTSLLFGGEAGFLGEFTSDLAKGVFFSLSPLNDEGPNVSEDRNLYLGEDLLRPGAHAYRLLTDSFAPQPPAEEALADLFSHLDGGSTDLSHVVFEDERNLTADAAGLGEAPGPRLYEWANGEVRLVGILPASEGGGPTIARAGQGFGSYEQGAISADGSRILFTGYSEGAENMPPDGRLYLRDDHGTADPADDTTVRVNVSEKTNGSGPGGGDPAGEQPATFWGASSDLSQIFFTSTEALTDDAPTDEPDAEKLYRYDLDAPVGDRLTLLSVDRDPEGGVDDGVDGIIGSSADGSYVYFIASGQLVPGMPIGGGPRIFLWHAGQIHEVAALSDSSEATEILGANGWYEKHELNGGETPELQKAARVSADGMHLAFVASGSGLVGAGQADSCQGPSPCEEVYTYSIAPDGEEQLRCASCREGGQSNSASADLNYRPKGSFIDANTLRSPYLNHALSSDGRFVFFTTEERLSPYDQNEAPDVYEFDSDTGRVQLLSGGEKGSSSYFLDASEVGRDAFFATRSSLVSGDGNQSVDVYDARIGGGFEETAGVPATPCASIAACRPATVIATEEESAVASGSGVPGLPHRHRHRAKRRHPRAKHRHRAKQRHAAKHHHRGRPR